MKKYLVMGGMILKSELSNLVNILSTLFSYTIHIIVFSFLWDFVLEGKTMAGFSKKELIWYVILAEVIMYSFNYYYRKIAYKVEMGDFAYDMAKPYNFMYRVIAEGIAEIPFTLLLLIVGIMFGFILAGPIILTLASILGVTIVTLLAATLLLTMHIAVGLLTIWLGRDVSSVWLLVSKVMLIFAFSPVDLFPGWMQKFLLLIPTTHVIYTPANLLVHFTPTVFAKSMVYELASFVVIIVVLAVIYKKGVRKQNVDGI